MQTHIDTGRSRIITADNGLHYDEILEVIWDQVYNQTLTDECRKLLPGFLDQYTVPHGRAFGDGLNDYETAFVWASQFGTVHVWPIDEDDIADDYPSIAEHGDQWVAKVGDPSVGYRAYARERIEAVILAGVQVLRDQASEILNPSATNATVN